MDDPRTCSVKYDRGRCMIPSVGHAQTGKSRRQTEPLGTGNGVGEEARRWGDGNVLETDRSVAARHLSG